MALLEIILYPDPRLRETCSEVSEVNDDVRALLSNMVETMRNAPGIGLAAPQVGSLIRALVLDVSIDSQSEESSRLYKLINPVVVESSGKASSEEGCLSIPEVRAIVTRPETVVVQALDEHGAPLRIEANGLLAVCLQHEIDHLNGVLFVDHISRLKKELIKSKLKNLERDFA